MTKLCLDVAHIIYLKKVIDHYGSQPALAKAMGICTANVNGWYRGRTLMPIHQAKKIQEMTHGKFKASKLLTKEKIKFLKSIGR